MKTRKSFKTLDDLKSKISHHEGGRVRLDEDGQAHWYSAEYTPTQVAMDLPGSCKITYRKLLQGKQRLSDH